MNIAKKSSVLLRCLRSEERTSTERCNIEFQGGRMEQVQEFKYLGWKVND